jgi:hypothetical protein
MGGLRESATLKKSQLSCGVDVVCHPPQSNNNIVATTVQLATA